MSFPHPDYPISFAGDERLARKLAEQQQSLHDIHPLLDSTLSRRVLVIRRPKLVCISPSEILLIKYLILNIYLFIKFIANL